MNSICLLNDPHTAYYWLKSNSQVKLFISPEVLSQRKVVGNGSIDFSSDFIHQRFIRVLSVISCFMMEL